MCNSLMNVHMSKLFRVTMKLLHGNASNIIMTKVYKISIESSSMLIESRRSGWCGKGVEECRLALDVVALSDPVTKSPAQINATRSPSTDH